VVFLQAHYASAQSWDSEGVEAEISNYYAEYLSAFSNQDIDRIADNYFVPPINIRNGSETLFFQTRSSVIDYFKSVFENLSGESYARSESMGTNICVLTDTTAIVSTGFRRFGSDGSIIFESAATYFLTKREGSWRFTNSSTHGVDRIISCDD